MSISRLLSDLKTATLQNVEYRKPLSVWSEVWIILEKDLRTVAGVGDSAKVYAVVREKVCDKIAVEVKKDDIRRSFVGKI